MFRIPVRFAVVALALSAVPAAAQFSESYNFLKAVKDRDYAKASDFLSKPGSVIVDTRDISTGETALHSVVRARELPWVNFLLGKGAKPDIKDKEGNTALMIATRLRFVEGATALIRHRATVDAANGSGETALIMAVQQRDVTMTRLLITNGANPDKRDTIAGRSAREYAKADPRAAQVLRVIEDTKVKAQGSTMGPKL
jgi:ankyrin repeat protein